MAAPGVPTLNVAWALCFGATPARVIDARSRHLGFAAAVSRRSSELSPSFRRARRRPTKCGCHGLVAVLASPSEDGSGRGLRAGAKEDTESRAERGDGETEAGDLSNRPERSVESVGVQAALDAFVHFVNASFDEYVWPWLGSCSVVADSWERAGGNFILRPSGNAKAVLHFIGGSFVGAAPHIAYSTLLGRLMRRGYCVVATPFDLSLNYLETTAHITSKWEAVESDLALEYGPIPVIGVGHSVGAVFHALASSLFDDSSPKAGLVLISYNNKEIKSAIPLYDIVVAPAARQVVAAEKKLPGHVRQAIHALPQTLDAAVEGNLLTPKKFKDAVMPIAKDARRVVEQIEPLVKEIGGVPRKNRLRGSETRDAPLTEFYPPPKDISAAVGELYAVEQTLVVKFTSDSIDESEVILENVRRRGPDAEISMMELDGNHLTPLVQDLPPPGTNGANDGGIPDYGPLSVVAAGTREVLSAFGTKEMYTLESLIDEWVLSGISKEVL